jgi:hypothetical protein
MKPPTNTRTQARPVTNGRRSQKLAALEEVAGAPPRKDRKAPQLDITAPLSTLARELGELLHTKPIFRMGSRLVFVDDETGETREVSPHEFRSWIEDFTLAGRDTGDGFKECSMSRETAQGVLASRIFVRALRVLNGVETVRKPWWNGPRSQEPPILLPAGYHEESGIYTIDALPYDLTMMADDAREFLLHYFEEAAFAEEGALTEKRSFSAHVAAMLTS